MRVERLGAGPIITPDLHPSIGTNIQGPSLIKVPQWLPNPLGRYYLYFADHKGAYIRLAYADDLLGPWTVHVPGSLHLADSHFLTEWLQPTTAELERVSGGYERAFGVPPQGSFLEDAVTPHIASPDVHVDDARQEIRMYYHGLESLAVQVTRVATSPDGLHFTARPEVLAHSYLRAFSHGDRASTQTYAMAMPGVFYRSVDGLGDFERGPTLFEPRMRHAAVLPVGATLHVFWTRVGDTPESILHSTVDISRDWTTWNVDGEQVVLSPEFEWEGAGLAVVASERGAVNEPVNQLRDPAVFVDDDRVFLLYAVAGEAGIALAEIHDLAQSG